MVGYPLTALSSHGTKISCTIIDAAPPEPKYLTIDGKSLLCMYSLVQPDSCIGKGHSAPKQRTEGRTHLVIGDTSLACRSGVVG